MACLHPCLKLYCISELRRISCHGRNYSQPYFFKRNQSSDNRSHGFGAKFLFTKLSASDFSYERKSALRLQLHSAIYRPDSFLLMLRYCENLKAIRYESMSLNRIVADKSHRVIVTLKRYGKTIANSFATHSTHEFFIEKITFTPAVC